jgi:hypothetical protein
MKRSMRVLAFFVSSSLVLASVQAGCATAAPQPEAQASSAGVVGQPSPAELDQLVAPIALYPDALVAQILAAATYPTEIVEADRWMQQHPGLTGDALAKAVDPQPWDPSVKALTQFPSVLVVMDKNLSWTSSLGDAYVNAQRPVLDAVQVMRRRAQQAGNLKSTPQEAVTTEGQTIVIAPANPEVVYVPEYDPWIVYGPSVAFYPEWVGVPGVFIDGPGVAFGLGIGIGAFAGFGWGWHHWDTDWHGREVRFDYDRYVSHSPDFIHRDAFGQDRPSFDYHGQFFHAGESRHGDQFQRGGQLQYGGGFPHQGGFAHAGGIPPVGAVPHGGFAGRAPSGIHSGAFGGFSHGGVAHGFSSRGSASFGGSLHGGGGAFHGGGGHR